MKKTIQTLVAGLMATGCLIAHGETQTAGGSSESSSGNPYEEMVQDFCSSAQQFSSALRTCGYHLLSEFNLHDCASALKGTSRRTKSASASDDFWSALIEGKKAVKTEIIKTFDYKNVGVGGAVIAATCGDVTIYFAVGEKGRKVEMDVFEKKEELEKILKEFEKVEKMDEKERRGLRQDAVKAVETSTGNTRIRWKPLRRHQMKTVIRCWRANLLTHGETSCDTKNGARNRLQSFLQVPTASSIRMTTCMDFETIFLQNLDRN